MKAKQLPAPSGLRVRAASTSEISLSWKVVPGQVQGYLVERRSSRGPFLQIAHLRASEVAFTDKNVSPGTRYEYRVRAYGPGISSANSIAVAASTVGSLKLLKAKGNGPVPPRQVFHTRRAR